MLLGNTKNWHLCCFKFMDRRIIHNAKNSFNQLTWLKMFFKAEYQFLKEKALKFKLLPSFSIVHMLDKTHFAIAHVHVHLLLSLVVCGSVYR